jgi:GT2 family glycosyltransferase
MRRFAARSEGGPKLNLLVSLHGAREEALSATLRSLAVQVHPHWRLCLVADPTTERAAVDRMIEAATLDPRVTVEVLDDAAAGLTEGWASGLERVEGALLAVLDIGVELAPHALLRVMEQLRSRPSAEMLYADEDRLDAGQRVAPFFKPGWSPELVLSRNYLGRFLVFTRSLLDRAGGFGAGVPGAEFFDLALRLTERTAEIHRLPGPLCHVPARGEGAGEPERVALERALPRRGIQGTVESIGPHRHRIRRTVVGEPLVSIVIPTRDRLEMLRPCLTSILERSSYRAFEILVADNQSRDPATLRFLAELPSPHRVVRCPMPFNWSAINDRAAREARGEQLLFLNNDVEVISPDWIQAMLEHGQRPEVGAVGAKLVYPDGTVQHAGVVVGLEGFAGNAFVGLPGEDPGHGGLAAVVRECSAVTGACMMVRRAAFEQLGGFDEDLPVAFNDVDFCLRLGARGLRVVVTPHALLCHRESASRPRVHTGAEFRLVRRRWAALVRSGDPFYNPGLALEAGGFRLRS